MANDGEPKYGDGDAKYVRVYHPNRLERTVLRVPTPFLEAFLGCGLCPPGRDGPLGRLPFEIGPCPGELMVGEGKV